MVITEEQALQIRELRSAGSGYKTIADLTGLSRDQVRYYCLSRGIGGYRVVYQANLKDRIRDGNACAYCGGPLMKPRTGRPRKFCSEACRRKYWKLHQEKRKKNPSAVYTMECPYCHRTFEVYGRNHRKYCCHEHYVLARFGHDTDCNPILDSSELYSGIIGRASVNFYAFNSNGNRGIACGLNNIQKLSDGTPLGGHSRAEDDFADLDDDGDNDDFLS